ncbi:MAG: hypothetical protein ABIS08_01630 [Pseudolysinimonas sp.]
MSFIATAIGTKVAIAALALVAVGGGTAVAAAATGGFDGAPASDPSETASATPTDDATETPDPTEDPTPSPSATHGPDATGPAAFGLCRAFTSGGLNTHSVAYAALLNASSSAGSIADYCAPILAAKHANNPKPTSHPTQSDDHGKSGDDHGDDSQGSHGH